MPKGNSKIDPEEKPRMQHLRKWWRNELFPEIWQECATDFRKVYTNRLDRARAVMVWVTSIPIFIMWILSMK